MEIAVLAVTPLVLGVVVGFWQINPVASAEYAAVGSEAHLLLEGFPDDRLVVEIAYQTTVGPPPGPSVATLLSRIHETCQKSVVQLDEHAFSSSQSSFSESQILTLESHVRQVWPTWGTMSLFYLYLGGSDSSNPGTLGMAYRGSSIAVFAGTIATASGAVGATAVTTTVLVHELGHELGLVGIVGYAPNEDPNHPYHSSDPSDVMYWAVETTAISRLSGGPPNQFSAADLSDLTTVKKTFIYSEVIPWIVLALVGVVAGYLLVSQQRSLRR